MIRSGVSAFIRSCLCPCPWACLCDVVVPTFVELVASVLGSKESRNRQETECIFILSSDSYILDECIIGKYSDFASVTEIWLSKNAIDAQWRGRGEAEDRGETFISVKGATGNWLRRWTWRAGRTGGGRVVSILATIHVVNTDVWKSASSAYAGQDSVCSVWELRTERWNESVSILLSRCSHCCCRTHRKRRHSCLSSALCREDWWRPTSKQNYYHFISKMQLVSFAMCPTLWCSHLSLTDDEEGVSSGPLSDDVLSISIMRLSEEKEREEKRREDGVVSYITIFFSLLNTTDYPKVFFTFHPLSAWICTATLNMNKQLKKTNK